MKNLQYLLLIICIAFTKLGLAQNKVAHFNQDLILKKMAEKRRALASWKTNDSARFSMASNAPATIAATDSLAINRTFLKVIKDWNYQYVFNPDYLLAAPPSGNLTSLVAKQLHIRIRDSSSCDIIIKERFAYCNRDSVLARLPEKKVIDTLLASYQNDSLSMEYDSLLAKFMHYDSLFIKDHHFSFKSFPKEDYVNCFTKLQNWVDYSSKKMQARQLLLLKPNHDRIDHAIKKLAEDGGYNYIFKGNFHYQGIKDISADVIKELQLANNASPLTLKR